jgi:uncharacterized protein (TIGR02118 family)
VIKLTLLYNRPDDPAAFDDYYFGTHIPLAQKIPNIERLEASRVLGADAVHVIAELWFADAETMGASFASPEGKAVSADVANFGAAGATRIVSEIIGS